MKKMYETPVCQSIFVDHPDVMTLSEYTKVEKSTTSGDFNGGATITW